MGKIKEDRPVKVYDNKLNRLYNTSIDTAKHLVNKGCAFKRNDGSLIIYYNKANRKAYKKELKLIDNRCYLCGEENDSLTLEHIIPLAESSSEIEDINVKLACERCNSAKKDMDIFTFLAEVRNNRDKYYYISLERTDEIESYAKGLYRKTLRGEKSKGNRRNRDRNKQHRRKNGKPERRV